MAVFRRLGQSVMIGFAVYPIIFLGIVALIALEVFADRMHMAADVAPLLYGLVFAALTVVMADLMKIASVVMALIASANLIEYAQLVIPGRNASAVDFISSLAGVIGAAVLIWLAHSFAVRSRPE